MMKLSTMKKVVNTVDQEWRSPLAEKILVRWGYDQGEAYYYRASANFIFLVKKDGKRYFLRFNDSSERDLDLIEEEVQLLLYLKNTSLKVAQPVKSLNDQYIETVETELGTFYAVVFEAMEGEHVETEDLTSDQFYLWGKVLGQLHSILKQVPKEISQARKSWKDHLSMVREQLPETEVAALKELNTIEEWADGLEITKDNYGVIHFDFEQDNLLWKNGEVGIIDFDDFAQYWFVADIAYALRDLLEEKVDFENQDFIQFLEGYMEITKLDQELLLDIEWFIRLHKLITFTKLHRSVDIQEDATHPESLNNLRGKLVDKLASYRESFERNLVK